MRTLSAGLDKFLVEPLVYDTFGTIKNGKRLTDANGDVVKTLVYDAFGNITYESASPSLSNLWNGMSGYYDEGAAIGLIMAGARSYDPALGSWISRDPLISEWPYGYCDHDPVNLGDSSGRNPAVLAVVAVPGVGEVAIVVGGACVATYLVVKGIQWLWNVVFAKGGRQNWKSSEPDIRDRTDEELQELYDKLGKLRGGDAKKLREKVKKEQKERDKRRHTEVPSDQPGMIVPAGITKAAA